MKPDNPRILTINGGSSSIKFALYQVGEPLNQGLHGKVDRIGLSGTNLTFNDPTRKQQESRNLAAADHKSAANFLIDWLEEQNSFESVRAVGHRVVHGMKHTAPELVTQELLDELHRISPNDPDHLPREIELIETFRQRHPKLPQVACFDTAFHQTMPRVAKLLPIPRRFDAKGIQRYGFHGLSYAYLMEELARLGDPAATKGRVILAHLGNGASLAAVRDGKSVDTSMGFTPTAGLVMSTRSGDLDPGLAPYLARTEQMTTKQFYVMVMSAYPNDTWGARLKVKPTKRTYIMAGIYNGDPSIRDDDRAAREKSTMPSSSAARSESTYEPHPQTAPKMKNFHMILVESSAVAIPMCIVTMLYWGPRASTQKLASKKWRFYWDYARGVLLLSLIPAIHADRGATDFSKALSARRRQQTKTKHKQ
jgi:hypothetical protein